MSMVFGDPHELAIEARFDGREGKWWFGAFRLWVAGAAYGDFHDTVDLAGGSRWGRTFLACSAARTRADLDHEDASAVYERLLGRFLAGGGGGGNDPFVRDPFLLDEVGESSLRDKVFVLVVRRHDGRDRVILRRLTSGEVAEAIISPGSCDCAVGAFCDWVDSLLPRET